MNFNSSNIDPVQRDIKAALKAVEEKHGISIKFGNIRYSDESYGTKMEVFGSNSADVAQLEFSKYASRKGLKVSAYGSEFMSRGTKFKVCGIKPKGKKNVIVAANDRGTRYVFPISAVSSEHRYF